MPILKSLYRLSEIYHINFKICCLTHGALSVGEPYYLRSLLTNRFNSYSLGSSSFNPLVIPCFKQVSYGLCPFSYAAPFLWNHLPNTIRFAPSYMSFRKNLKIYLFNQAFPTYIASSIFRIIIQFLLCPFSQN